MVNSQFPSTPDDRGKKRQPFKFSSDKHPGVGHGFHDPSTRSGKFADWSEGELWNYLKFLNNPPKPEDLEERPEGGYRP